MDSGRGGFDYIGGIEEVIEGDEGVEDDGGLYALPPSALDVPRIRSEYLLPPQALATESEPEPEPGSEPVTPRDERIARQLQIQLDAAHRADLALAQSQRESDEQLAHELQHEEDVPVIMAQTVSSGDSLRSLKKSLNSINRLSFAQPSDELLQIFSELKSRGLINQEKFEQLKIHVLQYEQYRHDIILSESYEKRLRAQLDKCLKEKDLLEKLGGHILTGL